MTTSKVLSRQKCEVKIIPCFIRVQSVAKLKLSVFEHRTAVTGSGIAGKPHFLPVFDSFSLFLAFRISRERFRTLRETPGFRGRGTGFCGRHPAFRGKRSGFCGKRSGFCGDASGLRGRSADFAGRTQDFAGGIRDFIGRVQDFAGGVRDFTGAG
jgi:hypothetical protein